MAAEKNEMQEGQQKIQQMQDALFEYTTSSARLVARFVDGQQRVDMLQDLKCLMRDNVDIEADFKIKWEALNCVKSELDRVPDTFIRQTHDAKVEAMKSTRTEPNIEQHEKYADFLKKIAAEKSS